MKKHIFTLVICTSFLISCSTTHKIDDPNYPKEPSFSSLSSNSERNKLFGKLKYKPWLGKGKITITNDWDKKYVIKVFIPQLKGVRDYNGKPYSGFVKINKVIETQYKLLWAAWEKTGLLDKVVSWGGGYSPRKVRGSWFTLSNHAYGTAFDINDSENHLDQVPAKLGEFGSVYELVPIAHDFGFFWGGHFSRLDGMHFEAVKVLSNDQINALKEKYSL